MLVFDFFFFQAVKLKINENVEMFSAWKLQLSILRCFPFPHLASNDSDAYKDQLSVLPNEQDLVREEAQKMSSLLPTMWLGAQNGW